MSPQPTQPAGQPSLLALLVSDLPGSASTDDLSVLVSQFAPVARILLAAPGGRASLGSALVLLASGDSGSAPDLHAVADALDCHPIAGGLMSVTACGAQQARAWLEESLLGSELCALLRGGRDSPAATQPWEPEMATPDRSMPGPLCSVQHPHRPRPTRHRRRTASQPAAPTKAAAATVAAAPVPAWQPWRLTFERCRCLWSSRSRCSTMHQGCTSARPLSTGGERGPGGRFFRV
ncbi:hypothetical protein ABPG75_005074 [Micractinium tetrahymenae]